MTPEQSQELEDAWELYLKTPHYNDLWDAFRAGWEMSRASLRLRGELPELQFNESVSNGR